MQFLFLPLVPEAATRGFIYFRNIHTKKSVLESLFNKIAGLKTYNFIIKETPTQEFSCEYWETFKNIYFEEPLLVAASKILRNFLWKI